MYRFCFNKQNLCFGKSMAYSLLRYDICHFTAQECPKNEKENLWLVFCEF